MTAAHDMQALHDRIAALEAEGAVRRVVAEYFRLCDTLGPTTSMAAIGALFARDAVWEGRGRYRTAFGLHRGREAIVAMLTTYADPPHFALNGHYLSSEAIVIHDAVHATGRWMMLQVSTYHNGRSDLRSAALTIDLLREDGAWRMSRFVTDNVFARDVSHWNDEATISVPQTPSEEGDRP